MPWESDFVGFKKRITISFLESSQGLLNESNDDFIHAIADKP
jgi:hypothetical protein